MVQPVGGNRTHLPASATNELVELETARVSAFWFGEAHWEDEEQIRRVGGS